MWTVEIFLGTRKHENLLVKVELLLFCCVILWLLGAAELPGQFRATPGLDFNTGSPEVRAVMLLFSLKQL